MAYPKNTPDEPTRPLTNEAIRDYAEIIVGHEAALEQVQKDKRDTFKSVRETYGKDAANALKLAIKRHRMSDKDKAVVEALDTEAERILTVLRAPRATRVENKGQIPPVAAALAPPASEAGSHAPVVTSTELSADQSTAARMDVRQSPERSDALAGFEASASDKQIPEQPEAAHGLATHPAGTQAPPVDTNSRVTASPPADEPASTPALGGEQTGTEFKTSIQQTYDRIQAEQAPKPRNWKHSDPAHPDCLNPEQCGGLSNLGICDRCKHAAGVAA